MLQLLFRAILAVSFLAIALLFAAMAVDAALSMLGRAPITFSSLMTAISYLIGVALAGFVSMLLGSPVVRRLRAASAA